MILGPGGGEGVTRGRGFVSDKVNWKVFGEVPHKGRVAEELPHRPNMSSIVSMGQN